MEKLSKKQSMKSQQLLSAQTSQQAQSQAVVSSRAPQVEEDQDPNLIADPIERQLCILKQRIKKSQQPGRVYTTLKPIKRNDQGVDMEPRQMVDLSEVVQLIKSDLPNTKARLRKQTYRSVMMMKKRNEEIAT